MSGDGGDELFAGYERYANFRWTRLIAGTPEFARRLGALTAARLPGLREGLGGRIADFLAPAGDVAHKGENHSGTFYDAWRRDAFTPELSGAETDEAEVARFAALFREGASEDEMERWLEVDQRLYLCDNILVKTDIASMAVGLECRAPMLDHRFAELANRLPMSAKLGKHGTKTTLRQLNARRLPPAFARARKKGFTLPLGAWMRSDLREWSHAMLFDTPAWEPYLRPDAVRRLWEEHQTRRWDHTMRLWSVMAWNLWARAWHAAP